MTKAIAHRTELSFSTWLDEAYAIATKADENCPVSNPMPILPGQRFALAAGPHCNAFMEMNPGSAGLIANHLNAKML